MQLEDSTPGESITDSNFARVRIIMWLSGKLNDAEKRYSMPEKEILAVVRALKETSWLTAYSQHPIKIYIDHKGIIDLMANLQQVHGRVSQWLTTLDEPDTDNYFYMKSTKSP